MNIIKRLVEEHKEMKQIAKEMRQEELLEKFKDWQELPTGACTCGNQIKEE